MFQKRKSVGLALGSGGAKGLAHIGVIKCFLQNNIPIDYISGSSIGALIGGLFVSLKDIGRVESIMNNFSYSSLSAILLDPLFKIGILKGGKTLKFIEKTIGDINIEDLDLPYCAVATNLLTGKPYYFNKGNLAEAIRASGSIPFLFKPVEINSTFLIDGGNCTPVPCKILKEMGADIIVAVNLISYPQHTIKTNKLSASAVLKLSLNLVRYHLAQENCNIADITISPNTEYFAGSDLTKFIKGQEIIDAGVQKANEIIPLLKTLIDK